MLRTVPLRNVLRVNIGSPDPDRFESHFLTTKQILVFALPGLILKIVWVIMAKKEEQPAHEEEHSDNHKLKHEGWTSLKDKKRACCTDILMLVSDIIFTHHG